MDGFWLMVPIPLIDGDQIPHRICQVLDPDTYPSNQDVDDEDITISEGVSDSDVSDTDEDNVE